MGLSTGQLARGDRHDNAPAEGFFPALKGEFASVETHDDRQRTRFSLVRRTAGRIGRAGA